MLHDQSMNSHAEIIFHCCEAIRMKPKAGMAVPYDLPIVALAIRAIVF